MEGEIIVDLIPLLIINRYLKFLRVTIEFFSR